jgi:hypothetical protein
VAAQSVRAAFGPRVIDVGGGGEVVGGTGRWRFWWAYGGGEDVVVSVGEEVAETTPSVEWGVQGTGEDGFLDASRKFVFVFGEVGDVLRAEMVACGPGVLPYGRYVVIGAWEGSSIVVLLEVDTHRAFGFAYVAGGAWGVGLSCAWGMVDHGGLVDVGDAVFEVDKLAAKGVPVVGDCSHLGLAK